MDSSAEEKGAGRTIALIILSIGTFL